VSLVKTWLATKEKGVRVNKEVEAIWLKGKVKIWLKMQLGRGRGAVTLTARECLGQKTVETGTLPGGWITHPTTQPKNNVKGMYGGNHSFPMTRKPQKTGMPVKPVNEICLSFGTKKTTGHVVEV